MSGSSTYCHRSSLKVVVHRLELVQVHLTGPLRLNGLGKLSELISQDTRVLVLLNKHIEVLSSPLSTHGSWNMRSRVDVVLRSLNHAFVDRVQGNLIQVLPHLWHHLRGLNL